MKRLPLLMVLFLGGFLLVGADGCSSDPNVEGAKLDLRNKDYDRALENLETALENDPQNAEAYALKGQVLQEQAGTVNDPERYQALVDEMLQAYNRALELDPELEEDITQRLRLAYYGAFQQGVQAFNRGQDNREEYNAAAEYFDMAAQIQPDSSSAYVNKAFALLNSGTQEAAIEPFEAALAAGDQQVETYSFLADLYRMTEQYDRMVDVLEQAREIYPDHEDLQAQLLNAYVAADQLDRAMEIYSDAVTREPGNKLYRYNYGSLLLQAERYEEAVEHLTRAVEIDPAYANAQYNLGAAYINTAVDLTDDINAIDDRLREESDQLSDAQEDALESEMESLADERRGYFQQAVSPLEQAKQLMEAEGEDATEVCRSLFSAYVQTGQQDKAEAIAECAGYEDLK